MINIFGGADRSNRFNAKKRFIEESKFLILDKHVKSLNKL